MSGRCLGELFLHRRSPTGMCPLPRLARLRQSAAGEKMGSLGPGGELDRTKHIDTL